MGCATSSDDANRESSTQGGSHRLPLNKASDPVEFVDLCTETPPVLQQRQQHPHHRKCPATNPLSHITLVDGHRDSNVQHIDGEVGTPFHPDPALEWSALPVDDSSPSGIPERAEIRRHRSASIGSGVAVPEPAAPKGYLALRMAPIVERGATQHGITDRVDQFNPPPVDAAATARAHRNCTVWADECVCIVTRPVQSS